MSVRFGVGLMVLIALVCGVAVWARPTAAASGDTPVRAQSPVVRSFAGVEADVARTALACMDARSRALAVLGTAVDRAVMLQRSVPPSAIAVGGGIDLAAVDGLAHELLVQLLAHAAAGPGAGAAMPNPSGVHFAWAGELRSGAPFYLRLHGPQFAVEWVQRGDGAPRAVTVVPTPYLCASSFPSCCSPR